MERINYRAFKDIKPDEQCLYGLSARYVNPGHGESMNLDVIKECCVHH